MIIKTNKGYEIEIDDEDCSKIMPFTWYVYKNNKSLLYAATHIYLNGKQKILGLHRLIMGAVPGQLVDHIDGNALNNKKSNLRFVSHAQNMRNSRKHKNCASAFKGVTTDHGGWQCRVRGKYIGRFKTEVDAAIAYDRVAKEVFGEYARLNFEE